MKEPLDRTSPANNQAECPGALRSFLDEDAASLANQPDDQVVRSSQGRITTRVRGSHVDITVSLARFGRGVHTAVATVIFLLGFLVGCNIYFAFTSGRVAQILDRNSGAHCAAIGDPVAAAECLYEQKKIDAAEQPAGQIDVRPLEPGDEVPTEQ
jgi:hypothetical protein